MSASSYPHHPSRPARRVAALAAAAGCLLPLLATGPALANEDDIIREGLCSSGADWKLKASEEDGRIEVEGEIDSGKSGQVWRWKIKHNWSISAQGHGVTGGTSGSFEVRRVLVDLPGSDILVFRGRNERSKALCRGVLTY